MRFAEVSMGGVASVGANSNIVRRRVSVITSPAMLCFSRCEFKYREAVWNRSRAKLGRMRFSRCEFKYREAAFGIAQYFFLTIASVGANSNIVRRLCVIPTVHFIVSFSRCEFKYREAESRQ